MGLILTYTCHTSEGWYPGKSSKTRYNWVKIFQVITNQQVTWIPAFVGMTIQGCPKVRHRERSVAIQVLKLFDKIQKPGLLRHFVPRNDGL